MEPGPKRNVVTDQTCRALRATRPGVEKRSYFFFFVVFFAEDFLVVAFFFLAAMALVPPFWLINVKLGDRLINGILLACEKNSVERRSAFLRAQRADRAIERART